MNPSDLGTITLPEPESLEQTGLAESLIEQLIVKILYFRGDLYGQDLSRAVGLRFSVIQDTVETLKLRHHVQVKRSLGVGNVGAVFALTETGRDRAREYLDANQYAGPAPVPLEQYCEVVRQQKPREGWLTREALRRAFKGMVLTEHVLNQMGPAVSSGGSLLIYGKPGDGKTFLVEQLRNLESMAIYVPYAIECQGNIVQVFDPIYHQPIEEEQPSVLTVALEGSADRRWVKCKRPFIVSGGELSLDMLDLRFNQNSKMYEAPFQLKANNGIYLIDDFGRQRATPAEVLNRWIVPMERRVDYLSFLTGGKMTVPFEAFLVFSTNLNPADLGDEAFLRRIQYKMLMRGPAENEFIRIFEGFCNQRASALRQGPDPALHRPAIPPHRQGLPPLSPARCPDPRAEHHPFREAAVRIERADSRPRLRELLRAGGGIRIYGRCHHHAGIGAKLRRSLGRQTGPHSYRVRHPGLRHLFPQPHQRRILRSRLRARVRRSRNQPRTGAPAHPEFP